jgi:hypothetical protein
MTSKTITYSPDDLSPNRGRRFEIRLSSAADGYFANVDEVLADGQRRRMSVPYARNLELHPSSFFRMRRHYRGFFIADVQAALRSVVVTASPSETGQADSTLFLKANMVGWPNGYPEAESDDMSDWLDE